MPISPPTKFAYMLASLAILLATGCQQASVFTVSTLPNQFRAPPTISATSIDFSRLARSPNKSETLYPGDVVDVQVATGIELEEPAVWKVRLDDEGVAAIPIIGAVRLAGLDYTRAEQAIRFEGVQRGKYIRPNVSVAIRERRSVQVNVLGAVAIQGTVSLANSNANLLEALTQAGNLTADASTIVEIRHPQRAVVPAAYRPGMPPQSPRIVTVDLFQAQANPNMDLHLEDGSTVVVRPRGERFISLMGLVRKRGQYKMPADRDLHLLEALSLGDGRTLQIADRVQVIRQIPGQQTPVVIEASIKSAKAEPIANLRLAPGDVVSVEETPLTFFVGTVKDFVRFGFSSTVPGF
jgi:polysaccharide export outer membrane protein